MLQLFLEYFILEEIMSKNFRSQTHAHSSHKLLAFLTSKWTFLGSLFLLLGVILPVCFYFISTVNQETIAKQKEAAEIQLIKKEQQAHFSQNSEVKVVHAKESGKIALQDKKIPATVQGTTEEQFQTILKKWQMADDDLFVSFIHLQSCAPAASKVEAGMTKYQWNIRKKTFVKQQETKLPTNYIQTETGAPITSQLLLQNNPQNLAQIHFAVQQALLDQAKNPEDILDDVLAIPAFTWQTPINYRPKELTVDVAKQGILNKTMIHLPYTASLAASLNQAYLDPTLAQTFAAKPEENQKQIALTFDDGPNPETTPSILNALKAKNVHATFFQLGSNAERYPNLVKRVAEGGHEIGSHTYHHYNLPKYPRATIQKEITDTDKAIYLATGKLPKFIRPPYGAVNATVAEVAGRPIIQWNIDSRDWATKNAGKTITQIQQTITNNGIILMHDIQPSTAEALPQLIDWLTQQGYKLVTIDQLLQSQEKPYYEYFSATDERSIS